MHTIIKGILIFQGDTISARANIPMNSAERNASLTQQSLFGPVTAARAILYLLKNSQV